MEKTYTAYDKGIPSLIYKELLQINKKKKQEPQGENGPLPKDYLQMATEWKYFLWRQQEKWRVGFKRK